jgi:excisionase family DNA binding protein
MVAAILDPHVVAAATQDSAALATIEAVLTRGGHVRLVSGGESVDVPPALLSFLAECLHSLEQDQPVTLVPPGRLLSAAEAADLLNVPRKQFPRLLESGALPAIDVDGEPRIRAADLLAYRRQYKAEQRQALAEIARLGQALEETGGGA